ncbi:hypothetical protein PLICRDRAFT_108784 [Plicaturopsis crispa FD-325 SS-3]|nr:hypothetical protein PLICRDRAFT_108784 [Plicaturopsis crispa FD-325 SS-3]
MEQEDGEIIADSYDPSYEWPGESTASGSGTAYPLLRLLVLRTSVLPSSKCFALISTHQEVQIGRDPPPPGVMRMRLKEMAVSKLHASIFWDARRREWAVVDMGSKHGTFLARHESDGQGDRLSGEREASMPKTLRHLDRLALGSTTFAVHVHADGLPCVECAPPSAAQEIPFASAPKPFANAPKRQEQAAAAAGVSTVAVKDPKKALTMLRRSLLTRHDAPGAASAGAAGGSYVDRSARRRALHPATQPDAPGIPVARPNHPGALPESADTSTPTARSWEPPKNVEVSQPPAPLPTTNMGHRLLMKQGWAPGTSLGLPTDDGKGGLVEPLEMSSTTNRAGLGMANNPSASSGDWREAGKRRMWNHRGR